jgi:hypothetical protein
MRFFHGAVPLPSVQACPNPAVEKKMATTIKISFRMVKNAGSTQSQNPNGKMSSTTT